MEINLNAKIRKMVEEGSLPNRLFCYQRLDEEGHTLDMIRNKQIWFSSPYDFNDPFDCRVYPDNISADYITSNAHESSFSRNFTRDMLKNNLSDEKALEFIRTAIDKVLSEKGIKCFTPHPDNILMWSHYADSHKGICIEFDVLEDPEFFTFPINVKYEKEYPKINFSNVAETTRIYSTKSIEWSYEAEIRVMKHKTGLHDINPSAFKSIIFGCKTPQENIDEIIEIISTDGSLQHIALKKANPDIYSFKINIIDQI